MRFVITLSSAGRHQVFPLFGEEYPSAKLVQSAVKAALPVAFRTVILLDNLASWKPRFLPESDGRAWDLEPAYTARTKQTVQDRLGQHRSGVSGDGLRQLGEIGPRLPERLPVGAAERRRTGALEIGAGGDA